MPACPYCAETIQAGARICRHCKSNLTEAEQPAPPRKSGVNVWIVLGVVLGAGFLIVIVGVALLLPAIHKATERAKTAMCANNLSQLWKMQFIYQAQFGGPKKLMPDKTGSEFWLELTRTSPPLIDHANEDILACPLWGLPPGMECGYLGPAKSILKISDGGPVGADRQGNHPKSGNVLRKSGDVLEVIGPDYDNFCIELKP